MKATPFSAAALCALESSFSCSFVISSICSAKILVSSTESTLFPKIVVLSVFVFLLVVFFFFLSFFRFSIVFLASSVPKNFNH